MNRISDELIRLTREEITHKKEMINIFTNTLKFTDIEEIKIQLNDLINKNERELYELEQDLVQFIVIVNHIKNKNKRSVDCE